MTNIHVCFPRTPAPLFSDVPVEPLFSVGDTVMHPSEGICTISEIRLMHFGSGAPRKYYILKPEMDQSSATVYLPVLRGNAVLRRLLTQADIDALISRARATDSLWEDDSKKRRERFSSILSSGDYAKIIRMISDIYEHNALRLSEGKKPCASDESVRETAETLLHQEFSHVLKLSSEETIRYIRKKLSV